MHMHAVRLHRMSILKVNSWKICVFRSLWPISLLSIKKVSYMSSILSTGLFLMTLYFKATKPKKTNLQNHHPNISSEHKMGLCKPQKKTFETKIKKQKQKWHPNTPTSLNLLIWVENEARSEISDNFSILWDIFSRKSNLLKYSRKWNSSV